MPLAEAINQREHNTYSHPKNNWNSKKVVGNSKPLSDSWHLSFPALFPKANRCVLLFQNLTNPSSSISEWDLSAALEAPILKTPKVHAWLMHGTSALRLWHQSRQCMQQSRFPALAC